MRKVSNPVSVYRFLDAREFLRQAYLERKRVDPAFSQRYIAQALKSNSSSFFRQVLAGKSPLTRARVVGLARLFGLSRAEAAYFEDLAAYTEAGTEEEKRVALEKLRAVDSSGGHTLLEAFQAEYFSKWHYAAVRELLAIHDFRGNHDQLGALLNPPLSATEARDAIQLLLRLKLIRKAPGGAYRSTDRVVLSGTRVSATQVRPALLGHLDLARRALDAFPAGERPFSYATISASEKSMREIREKFQAFRREVFDLIEKDDALDRVYQMNFQLFPVSETVPRRKK